MKRILYRSEEDDQTTVSYYVEPDAVEGVVRWSFYPHTGKGMHWKKADEMGMGSFHDDTRQSFEEFKIMPAREISAEIYEQVTIRMEGLSELEITAKKMGPSGMEFNRVSLPSYAQMKNGISEPTPVAHLSNHDFFPSWEFVKEIIVKKETQLLYRCAEHGMMWVHVDDDGMAHETSLVSNEEARNLYKKYLLYFTEDEKKKLKETLQIGVNFQETLEDALGSKRIRHSFYFPDVPCDELGGFVRRAICISDAGIVRAAVNEDGEIVNYRLIQGLEAWRILQPIIDPE